MKTPVAETISQMRNRHRREIKALQRSCKHPGISRWSKHMWAPAYFSGFEVKVCNRCGKEVNRRDPCYVCKRWVDQQEHKEGLGTATRPAGAWYHAGCLPRTPEEIARDESARQEGGTVRATRAGTPIILDSDDWDELQCVWKEAV